MLIKDGIPTQADLQQVIPNEKRLQKGPVAILECFQRIPCAPCAKACPQGAIFIGDDINDLPGLDADKCIGCKLCYSKCPQKCIDISKKPVVIRQEHCLHCGNCYEICPARAIERR